MESALMVYEVPESKKSKGQSEYEFKLAGKTFTIPKFKYLPPRISLRLDSNQGLLAFFGKYAPDALDLLEDNEQLQELFKDYQRDSGITVGESLASTDS
jgi:exonuclease V gamma subunit